MLSRYATAVRLHLLVALRLVFGMPLLAFSENLEANIHTHTHASADNSGVSRGSSKREAVVDLMVWARLLYTRCRAWKHRSGVNLWLLAEGCCRGGTTEWVRSSGSVQRGTVQERDA